MSYTIPNPQCLQGPFPGNPFAPYFFQVVSLPKIVFRINCKNIDVDLLPLFLITFLLFDIFLCTTAIVVTSGFNDGLRFE
jgi:hypothetical protein